MDNRKDDLYYLEKIKADLAFVIGHTAGKTKAEIESDEVLVDSILFRIIQIAENNGKLSDRFKAAHGDVPWIAIRGMRNIIVHDYGFLDLTVVYDTVMRGMPEMLDRLEAITQGSADT